MLNSYSPLRTVIQIFAIGVSFLKLKISVKILDNVIQKAHREFYPKPKSIMLLNESIVVRW